MSDISPNLALPYLAAAQTQKHVTLNESLRALDPLVQLVVQDHEVAMPPASPAEGDAWVIAAGGTDAWSARDGEIAAFMDGAWEFHQPRQGWRAWSLAADGLIVFDGAVWTPVTAEAGESVERLAIATQPDAENPFAARLPNALFTCVEAAEGGSGDVRIKLNRETASDTASVLFQTGFAGRAEFGLIGNDAFTLKTSADGTGFVDAVAISTATGHVGIGETPSATDPLAIRKDQAGATQFTVSNYDADSGASSTLRLNAANGHYFNFRLYGSGSLYAYSSATMIMGTYAARPLYLRTDTQDRMTIHTDGRVSLATPTASAQLSVDGAVRVGQSTSAGLPSASANGAGAILYVSGLAEGPALAISDGTSWRKLVLGAAI